MGWVALLVWVASCVCVVAGHLGRGLARLLLDLAAGAREFSAMRGGRCTVLGAWAVRGPYGGRAGPVWAGRGWRLSAGVCGGGWGFWAMR